ncbi:MAG: hypothetical protein ACK4TA_16075 [Saprospiraceae bacterium]
MRRQIKLTVANLILVVALLSFSTLRAEQLSHSDLTTTSSTDTPTGKDSAKTAKAAKAEATLVGRWENPYFVLESGTNGQDSNGRSLKYHFREDGTYTRILGGAETQIEEAGNWEISTDGTQLLMRSRSVCDGKMVVTTANIKHLSMDELVLEQTMCVAGVMVASNPQEFYFNKF